MRGFTFKRFPDGWFYCRKGLEFDSLSWSLRPHRTRAAAVRACNRRITRPTTKESK